MDIRISALDIANLRLVFGKLDEDGDGTLTLEEMRAGAHELGISPDDVETLFKTIDVDNSGQIDYTELADNFADFTAAKLRRLFEKLDKDGDGTLTLEEMKQGVDDLGIEEAELETLFRKMDADGSGEIDYSEFANKLLQEMSGGWAKQGQKETEESRFALLGHKALQVHVISLEGLPHRSDDLTDHHHAHHETFAVRLRWPSAPFFGESELHGLVAYDWGTPRHRPRDTHGAYVYVDQTLRLPWVSGQPYAMLDIYEQDLMRERLIGSVKLSRERLYDGSVRRYAFHDNLSSDTQGFAHIRVAAPKTMHQRANVLADVPAKPRRVIRSARASNPWWSPFGLCSTAEYAESC